jgi:endonuclease/exonuclease/phosphatase family metal-dependent hydrolase
VFDTPEPSRTLKTLFGALVFTLGAQSMRFLFGSITWYLRDTLGIATLDLVPIALAPFLLGAIIPLLGRWLSVRGALGLGLWLLVVGRIVNQVIDSPSIDFFAAAIATMAFVGLLPLMMSMGRSAMVGGLLLGIALDSAIKGMGLSLDLAFQDGIGPAAAVVALGAGAVYLLWAAPPVEREGVTWGSGMLLLGIGPFLFFEMLVLQNQGWTAEVAQIGGAQAQMRITLLNVVALLAVGWWERNRLALLVSILVLVSTVIVAENGALLFNFLSLLAVPAAGLVWAGMVPDPESRGLGASITYLTLGMVLFIGFGLAYYIPMDLRLGFGQQEVRIAAALVLLLFAIGAFAARVRTRPGATRQTWAFAAIASVLSLFGLFAGTREGQPVETGASFIRFLSYNIHSSYDVEGRFDIEAIADVIDGSGATVVGLQELPRGRLLSGVTDELTLLANRLGFEHVAFFGTSDPTWGNAILSRFPIISVDRAYLPQEGTPLRRGYLGAKLDVGGREILFISTHLQHVNDPEIHDERPEADLYPVHTVQVETILTEWGGFQPAVMAGDFNARPGWRQVEELLAAGWVDAWSEAGEGAGLTSNAVNPQFRIDYIFHTPDLMAVDAGVIQSRASDHFAVAADIQNAESDDG